MSSCTPAAARCWLCSHGQYRSAAPHGNDKAEGASAIDNWCTRWQLSHAANPPVLAGAELPEVLCRLRRNICKELHFDAARRQPTNRDVCRGARLEEWSPAFAVLACIRVMYCAGAGHASGTPSCHSPKKTTGFLGSAARRCHCVSSGFAMAAPQMTAAAAGARRCGTLLLVSAASDTACADCFATLDRSLRL